MTSSRIALVPGGALDMYILSDDAVGYAYLWLVMVFPEVSDERLRKCGGNSGLMNGRNADEG